MSMLEGRNKELSVKDADANRASSQTLAIMGEAKKRHNMYKNITIKDMFERNPKA